MRVSSRNWLPQCRLPKVDSKLKSARAPFDPVVKIGLSVLIGGIALIAGGMFLSRPDRTIPPFSIGAQENTVVAVHVPAWTSDPEIESLIRRFRKVGVTRRDFRSLKVRPTTPDDPNTLYGEVILYIFSDSTWTERDVLHQYLAKHSGEKEEAFRRAFERSARGGFIYARGKTKGWLGPIPGQSTPQKSPTTQILFDDAAPSLMLSGEW